MLPQMCLTSEPIGDLSISMISSRVNFGSSFVAVFVAFGSRPFWEVFGVLFDAGLSLFEACLLV
jgi:hypothetical protein